jgi:hypothetical protein
MIQSIFLDHTGQLSFKRHSLVNLLLFTSAVNIPLGILRAVTGIVMTVAVGMTVVAEVEVEAPGVAGAIWLKNA